MRVDILTIFPKMFRGPFEESLIKKAQEKGLVEIKIHDLRKWAKDRHKTVDDKPYGGGAGMVMMIEPIYKALQELKEKKGKSRVVLLTPQGQLFNQKAAERLAKLDQLILLCGHYEGVDERVREHLVEEEISIGDYVLTGGELAAMVVVDAVVRLVPGVVGKEESLKNESFSLTTAGGKLLLDYPQYTRPAEFKGWKVPEVLLSGDHQRIAEWRRRKALEKTKKRRPDLLR